ncbi:MBL fold metallo-hydrolase, partial [Halorussus sp. GCM10023401]
MRVSYQVANPKHGSESYLLRFEDDGVGGQTACVLFDSGTGVDVEALLGDDEYLTAVFLTHAHLDHYATLTETLRDGAPVYASRPTAEMLGNVFSEGEKHYDVGDHDDVLDALTPLDDWESFAPNLEARPVPAGHAPGAAGFVVCFVDGGQRNHVLVTGDFTKRGIAGYPGLPTTYPEDVDVLVVNGSTTDGYGETLTDALATTLQRAESGSSVLVTASGLTGAAFGYQFAHLCDHLDARVPVTLAGQVAKLYDDLDYAAPTVEAVPVFDDPAALLERGGVTVAGPEIPVEGSARHLFDEIEGDAAATLVQLVGGATDPVESAGCTVYDYELVNHPGVSVVDDLVADLDPIHVVVGHGTRRSLERYRGRYDDGFVWLSEGTDEHVLYDDGRWTAPPWLNQSAVKAIRAQDWRHNGARGSAGGDWGSVPSVERRDAPDLAAEGVALDRLEERFLRSRESGRGSASAGDASPV